MQRFDRATDRYFRLLDALDQAVIATDAGGVIIYWSAAAEKLYGWPTDDVLCKNILTVTPTDLSREKGSEIMRLLQNGEAWSGEFSVRGQTDKPFLASVTDVPLLGDGGTVSGVIGVSARSHLATGVRALLKRFAKACETVWPGQVIFDLTVPRNASLIAAEPHLIQLFSILLLRYAEALDEGASVEFKAGTAQDSPFAEFGLVNSNAPALYIRLDRSEERAMYSVLRNIPDSVRPRQYASALVRMVGGLLIEGAAPERANATHLFLPLRMS